jgi:L-fuconolactonase
MLITDSQVHLYLPDTPGRPWPEQYRTNSRELPEFLPSTLLRMMKSAGVGRAVIVPPIWAGLDNEPCLRWAREYPEQLGIMGRFDFQDPDPTRLEGWLDRPGMLGIRLSGQLETGDWLDVDQFRWFWSAIERLGIPVMVLTSGSRIRSVDTLAAHFPEARLIIDHLAVSVGDLDKIDPWENLDDVLALAKHPNVYGKLSALPLNTLEPYPYPSQTPIIRRVYDAFGPQRLAWGSDGSRLRRSSYHESVDHILQTIEFFNDDDREWIMGKTISALLNWSVPDNELSI